MSYDIVPGRPGQARGSRFGGAGVAGAAGGAGVAGGRDALRRYVLTRALATWILNSVQLTGIGVLIGAVLVGFAGLKWLAVLLVLLAAVVLLFRVLLSAVVRRLAGGSGRADAKLTALVRETRRELRHELRRVGLPGTVFAPTAIVVRLIRTSRRSDTLERLAAVDLSTIVPQSRLDDLELVIGRTPPR
jgi:hypothetical protein